MVLYGRATCVLYMEVRRVFFSEVERLSSRPSDCGICSNEEGEVKQRIELDGDSYIVEFAPKGWAKVSKKNSSQPLTPDEAILSPAGMRT
jgi:hypothetical protein